MANKPAWRKYQDAMLKKVLERARGKEVSDRDVQNYLEYDPDTGFYARNPTVAKPASYYEKHPEEWKEFQASQAGISAPTPDALQQLMDFADSKTELGSESTDRRNKEQNFWETQEFKDSIKEELSMREEDKVAFQGVRQRAPISPDILADRISQNAITRYATKQVIANQPSPEMYARIGQAVGMMNSATTNQKLAQQTADTLKAKADELLARAGAAGVNDQTRNRLKIEAQKLIDQANNIVKETGAVFIGGTGDSVYSEPVPFFRDTDDEIKAAEFAYQQEPTVQNAIGLQITKFGTWMSKLFYTGLGKAGITWGGTSEEETLFNQYLSPVGGVASGVFNTAAALKDTIEGIFTFVDPYAHYSGAEAMKEAERLRAEAAKLKEKHPDTAALMLATANNLEEQAQDNTSPWQNKLDDIKNSWRIVGDEFKRAWDGVETLYDIYSDPNIKSYEEAKLKVQDMKRQYTERSSALHNMSLNQYDIAMKTEDIAERDISFQRAIQLEIESIEASRKGLDYDAYGAATWVREPERYESFIRAAAMIQLQTGEKLSVLEVRRLKDMYTNPWTELTFQMVFDVTNLPIFGAIGSVPEVKKLINRVTEPIARFTSEAKTVINDVPVLGWLTRQMVDSTANKIASALDDSFFKMKTAYATSEDFIADMPKIQSFVDYAKVADTKEVQALFDASKSGDNAIQAFKNISFNDFRKIAALDIDGLTWKNLSSGAMDVVKRIKSAYPTSAAFIRDFGAIRKAANSLKGLSGENAEKVFAKLKIAGLKNVGLDEFLGFANEIQDAKPWGQILQESINSVQAARLKELRAKAGLKIGEPSPREMIEEARKYGLDNTRLALMDFAGTFGQAYKGMHSIYAGSVLHDDTIAGQILRLVRIYGAAQDVVQPGVSKKILNPKMLNLSKFDEFVAFLGMKASDGMRANVLKHGTNFIETLAGIFTIGRQLWSTVVLSTPRWIINNYLDSSARSFVYGGNVFDDFMTLHGSTQMEFIDEVGIAPMAFHQQLGKAGITLSNTAIYKTVYGGEKPKWGLLSYWRHEWDRLNAAPAKEVLNIQDYAPYISDKLKNNIDKLGTAKVPYLWNGFKTISAFSSAISDYNAAIEFTLRIRMFHREYFKMLRELEPEFISRGMEALSPNSKALALHIWKESRSNPAKISAMIDSLATAGRLDKKAPASWSFTLPTDWEDTLKAAGMDEDAIQPFTYLVREQVDGFLSDSVKATGKIPTPEAINKFVDDAIESLQNQTQDALSHMHDVKEMDMTINPEKTVVENADYSTLKGSAPNFNRPSAINEAIARLQSGKTAFKKGTDVIEDYTTAISRYGTVRTVEGGGVRVVRTADGLTIEIGKDVSKAKDAYTAVHDATIKIIATQPPEVLRNLGFKNAEQFEDLIKAFTTDPAKVLNDNAKAFKNVLDMLDANSDLLKILKQTGNVANFEGAAQLFRRANFDVFASELLNDPGRIEDRLQALADLQRPVSPERRIAADNLGPLALERETLIRSMPDFEKFSGDYSEFLRLNTWYRDRYNKKFLIFSSPGPKTEPIGAVRRAKWDEVEHLEAAMYEAEYRLHQELMDAFKKSSEEGQAFLKNMLNDFPEEYLRRMDIKLLWDDKHEIITHATITRINRYGDKIVHTWPMGSSVVEHLQSLFFSPIDAENANILHRLHGTKFNPEVRREINFAIHDAFNVTNEQANTFRRILELHGQRYTEVTGKPISDYLAKWGFQEINGTFQLPKDAILLNSGIIQRAKDGTYTLFGGPHSDFGSLMRSASVVFLEDLKRMAISNPAYRADLDALFLALEKATGSKVRNGKLSVKQLDTYATFFLKYFNGEGTELKSGFDKLSRWMADTFIGLKDSSVLEDLPEDAADAMNRMFIREQMKPKSSGSVADVIAHEINPELTANEVLEQVNNPVVPESDYRIIAKKAYEKATPEQQLELDVLIAQLETERNPFLELQLIERIDTLEGNLPSLGGIPGWTQDLWSGDTYKRNAHILDVSKKLLLSQGVAADDLAGMTQLEIYEAAMQITPVDRLKTWLKSWSSKARTYGDIKDVPASVIEAAFGTPTKISEEMQQAWDAWKLQSDLKGFAGLEENGIKVLDNPDTLRAYIRYRLNSMPLGDLADEYERVLYNLEAFQDSFIKYSKEYNVETFAKAAKGKKAPKPVDWGTVLNQPIRKFQMHDGIKTWIASNVRLRNNLEAGMQGMENIRKFLLSGEYKTPTMSAETLAELKAWGETATKSKADLISTLLSGGEVNGMRYKGAVDTVNGIMLDYSSSTNFDGIMKNLFPFWMFPSRSLPFWAKTLATHPELISFYNKIQKFSAGQRYQAGAVNSKGQPLTSMDGYVPIPGTDMWFNPLAPFSFRYVLDATQSQNEAIYRQHDASDQDIPIDAYLAREFLESGPMFGFNVAPWMSWIIKDRFNISDETLPPFPLAPTIPLFPRWMYKSMVEMANKMNINISGVVDAIFPESSWHDNIVEREILLKARAEIESAEGPSATLRREAIIDEARRAISEKGDNPLWNDTYKEVTNSEAWRANLSFFTGIYPKEFSDAQADLYALRNELNLQKSAMNSLFQTSVFELPADAHDRWNAYINQMNTTDGWIYRMYTDINYVRNDEGRLIKNREERNKYLAAALQDEVNQQSYYLARKRASYELNERLKDLPVGTPYEIVSKAYEDYFKQINLLQEKFPFNYSRSYGTYKPVELIQEELTDTYFKMLISTRPQFNPNQEYDVYREKIVEWEARLPTLAEALLRQMYNRADVAELLQNLHADQKLDPKFFENLLAMSNAAGVQEWHKGTDTISDALNNAWRKLYWDEYWNTIGPLRGAERDLAEHDFSINRPPPTDDELIAWIQSYYGDKFDPALIMRWLQDGERPINSIDERVLADKGEEYVLRQNVYDLLSWLGPSKRQAIMEKLNIVLVDNGAEENVLQDWMKYEGKLYTGEPDKLKDLLDKIKAAYATLGIEKPNRDYLVEYVQAEDANAQFKNMVNTKFKSENAYERITELQTLYYSYADAGRKEKKQFIQNYPNEYSMLQTYWDMRKAFGNTSPIWAKYYLWEPETPTQFQGVAGDIPLLPQEPSVYSGGGGGGGTYRPEEQPALSSPAQPMTPSFVPWPPDMKNAIGSTLAGEIEALYAGKRYLTAEAKQFLRGVKSRHPEWAAFINQVFAK